MKTVLITGASTGIGQATAQHMAEQGWTVFAGVRKETDRVSLKALHANIIPLILDVTSEDQIASSIHVIEKHLNGATLNGLVNNAGIANMGPLALQPLDEIKWHFDVNVFGLIAMTKAALPLLGMDEARTGAPGRIVNISSAGGRIAAPFLGSYSATKHAVESLTDSFRRELMPVGIDAICVGPGAVKTPIWAKSDERNQEQPYKGTIWEASIEAFAKILIRGGETGLPASEIAETIEHALTADKPKARYAPVPNKFSNWIVPTSLPKRMLDKGMAKIYKLTPR